MGFLHTNQESLINANAGPDQTYALMLLTYVNCTHVFWMLQAHWSCRYKLDYRPRAKCSLQVFNRSGRHFSAEKQENSWSVRKLTIIQRFGMKNINRWAISAHMHTQSHVRCGCTQRSNTSIKWSYISSILRPIKIPPCISMRKRKISLKTTQLVGIWKNN